MSISIIIPVFNKEKQIANTIKSVLSQSESDFEVLLIDDGSTDKSADIIKQFLIRDSRLKYFYKPNGGVSSARNYGLSIATGEYITFLDADDAWEENFLEEMRIFIGNSEVCYCGHYYYYGMVRKPAKIKYKTGNILVDYIKNVTTPHTNSWLIKKEYIQKYQMKFPESISWGEDMSFFIKVLTHCKEVKTPKKRLTRYYKGVEDSLSKQDPEKIYYDLVWMNRSIEYIESNLEDKETVNKSKQAFISYRIPAAIVYRLNMLIDDDNFNISLEYYQKYKKHLERISMVNGLRSVKLYVERLKLKKRMSWYNR